MDTLLVGIIGSIIGGGALWMFQLAVTHFREDRGLLTGEWDQIIPAQKNQPEKHDLVNCRDNGSKLRGSIERINPAEQSFKKWQFQGQRRGSLLFMTFWTTNLKSNPGSYGTIQLHSIGENHWKGFYVKLIVTADKEMFTGQLEKFDLEWKLRKK
jgi:hypothetical protein